MKESELHWVLIVWIVFHRDHSGLGFCPSCTLWCTRTLEQWRNVLTLVRLYSNVHRLVPLDFFPQRAHSGVSAAVTAGKTLFHTVYNGKASLPCARFDVFRSPTSYWNSDCTGRTDTPSVPYKVRCPCLKDVTHWSSAQAWLFGGTFCRSSVLVGSFHPLHRQRWTRLQCSREKNTCKHFEHREGAFTLGSANFPQDKKKQHSETRWGEK